MQKVNPVNLILAIFLPPIGALLQVGLTTHFFINVLLTILGVIPGVIHAVWLVLTDKKG
ncbi:YqaE/Pmp3 family membrane protein [Bowmanella dokdonensis]|uniref:YqaE/Pmp3 family membrane protein n=1 Tax=Bowmanella dokdonensis TaxID=751969 RepID=A0A939DNN2_9ALTE|nr:YqaE/Pmp3 family membrane protein [Bowmanella dokdonensis]MBN7825537.1 YqaE/Pmp3 family membrane protein [Bowmanella dokdonensis]